MFDVEEIIFIVILIIYLSILLKKIIYAFLL